MVENQFRLIQTSKAKNQNGCQAAVSPRTSEFLPFFEFWSSSLIIIRCK